MTAADLQAAIKMAAELAIKPHSDGSKPSFEHQLIVFVGVLEGALRSVDPLSADRVHAVGRTHLARTTVDKAA